MDRTDTQSAGIGTGGLIAAMLVFVVAGAPMVYYLWSTINELLAGRLDLGRLGITLVVLIIFLGLLNMLTRTIRRWEQRLH